VPLTLREVHVLRVFQKRMLRRIFGPKRNEIVEGWKRLHYEEFHNLHSSPRIIKLTWSRSMKWMGHVVHMREKRNAYRILAGKPKKDLD
jgi:hypothetical protein